MNLPDLPIFMDTAIYNLARDLYDPCLQWATSYDRGVGYFTSAWLRENSVGLSYFATNGGIARWLISPILDPADLDAMERGYSESENVLTAALLHDLAEIQTFLEEDTLNALAWLIADDILNIRVAVPTQHLNGGDFHPKFGIFRDSEGNSLAFTGSVNDSHKGTLNYEVISIFSTWKQTGEYVEVHAKRFEDLWDRKVPSVKVHDLPMAVRDGIIQLRSKMRPYTRKTNIVDGKNLWPHQASAVTKFLKAGHGVLEMATGTGKTRTALSVIKTLLAEGKIDRVIVSVDGTDLLDQWDRELLRNTNLTVSRQYGGNNDLPRFQIHGYGQALIISRDFLARHIHHFPNESFSKTLAIFDEVHGMGSPLMVKNLSGIISQFGFRLGLSATPEREFDEIGTKFIEDEIGPVIFQFGIDKAIRTGILSEFDYVPLEFRFTQEDEDKRRPLVRALLAATNSEHATDLDIEDIQRRLSAIRKLSVAKLPVFESYLARHPETLNRTIIFVETMEYGRLVQDVILRFTDNYHTYFGEDAKDNLVRFASGDLDCLITSRRISEGIDIRSVNNVVLFTADHARLQTIQRIGRCLRTDPGNPDKRARVIDFVESNQETDRNRKAWLTELSSVKREGTRHES